MKSIVESINISEGKINNIKQFEKALGDEFSYLATMDPNEVYDMDEDELNDLADYVTSDEYLEIVNSFSSAFERQNLSRLEEIENNIGSIV